jgi:hypothetical protein
MELEDALSEEHRYQPRLLLPLVAEVSGLFTFILI